MKTKFVPVTQKNDYVHKQAAEAFWQIKEQNLSKHQQIKTDKKYQQLRKSNHKRQKQKHFACMTDIN